MTDIEFKEDNEGKYGRKEDDLISLAERNFSAVFALNFCLFTALKYKTRMANGKGRLNDEKKLNDYLQRYEEICKKYDYIVMKFEDFEYMVKHGIKPNE